MIYNTRNQRKDTTVSLKEKKTFFNAHFQYSQSEIMYNKDAYSSKKTWSLRSLTKLKCESRTSLPTVQL